MKKRLVICLTVCGLTALTACGQPENPTAVGRSYSINSGVSTGENISESMSIAGTYVSSESVEEDRILILNEDGTGIHKRDGQEFECTWRMDGATFILQDKYMSLTVDYTGKIDVGKLQLHNGDPGDETTYNYEKK